MKKVKQVSKIKGICNSCSESYNLKEMIDSDIEWELICKECNDQDNINQERMSLFQNRAIEINQELIDLYN